MERIQDILFALAALAFVFGGMVIDSSIPAAIICFCIAAFFVAGVAVLERVGA